MFTKNDEDKQELIRTELLLPYLINNFPTNLRGKCRRSPFCFHQSQRWLAEVVILCGAAPRLPLPNFWDWKQPIFSLRPNYFPTFIQCAEVLRDGGTICAQTLQTLLSTPAPDGNVRALLIIDLRIAFHEANRHGVFYALTGKASRTYDEGRVQIGDELLHLGTMKEFFLYFKAMH